MQINNRQLDDSQTLFDEGKKGEMITYKNYLYTNDNSKLAVEIFDKIKDTVAQPHSKINGMGRLEYLRIKMLEHGYDYPIWYLKECFREDVDRRKKNHIVMSFSEKYLQ